MHDTRMCRGDSGSGPARRCAACPCKGGLYDGADRHLIARSQGRKAVVRLSVNEASLEETVSVAAEGIAFETVPRYRQLEVAEADPFPVPRRHPRRNSESRIMTTIEKGQIVTANRLRDGDRCFPHPLRRVERERSTRRCWRWSRRLLPRWKHAPRLTRRPPRHRHLPVRCGARGRPDPRRAHPRAHARPRPHGAPRPRQAGRGQRRGALPPSRRLDAMYRYDEFDHAVRARARRRSSATRSTAASPAS